jgi:hypothetical protein
VGRLIVVLIPVLGVFYPLMRFLPALYGWAMRSKVTRLYGELRQLEDEMERRGSGGATAPLVARLDRLVKLPPGFANQLYMLRDHIALVRTRLNPG